MNNLVLLKFELKEMDTNEMVNIEGGAIGTIAVFLVSAWLADSLINYHSTVKNFKKGYNSVN